MVGRAIKLMVRLALFLLALVAVHLLVAVFLGSPRQPD